MPKPAPLSPRLYWLCAGVILLIAAWLRVDYAGSRDVLWRDELFEITVGSETESVSETLAIVREDGQSPLSYLVTRAIDRGLGRDFLLGRWHVLLAGGLSVLVLMELARRWFGPRCALLAGLFAATSPFLIFYSAELRGYALYSLMTLVYFGVYFEFRERRTAVWALAWGAAAALLAYAHYFGLFFVLVSGLLSLLDRPRKRSLVHAGLGGLAFLFCMLPWLPALTDALLSGKQHWATAHAELSRVASPAWLATGRAGRFLLWSGMALGAWVFWLRRWPDRERRVFTSLLVIVFGSAMVAWLVQLQGGRGMIHRYFIGHTLVLLPPALLYWSRVGTLGDVAIWRGLKTGRVYRLGARAHTVIGLLFVGVTLFLQIQDPKRLTGRPLTSHEFARAFIAERLEAGDLIIAGNGFMAEAFGYHCRGTFDVLRVPPITGESSIHGPTRVDPAELAQRWDAFLAILEQHLSEGGRIWYYVLDSRVMFPIPDDGARGWEKARARLIGRGLERRKAHRRTMDVLERDGERIMLQRWPRTEVKDPTRLMLYRADSQASNARLRSKPQR